MNRSHARSHVAATDGYRRPSPLCLNSSSALRACSSLTAPYTSLSFLHMALRSWSLTNRLAARTGCTTQVCAIACGHVASTASGRPFSPSRHTTGTFVTPLLAICAHTFAQNEDPSESRIQMPGTCLSPSMSTPIAPCTAFTRPCRRPRPSLVSRPGT